LDLVRLRFVNEWGKDWLTHYNDFLWEYFNYHGRTPNGEPLDYPTSFHPGIEFITVDLTFEIPKDELK
jgi:hypothetical protein